jgi:L-amino acid N-acyltransferase YncA
MTIREIRRDDAAPVTDLYLEACSPYSERDPDWGVPDWDAINRWVLRTTESDDAVCLVAEVEGEIVGYLLASVARHPAMPGVLGKLESSTCARVLTRTG